MLVVCLFVVFVAAWCVIYALLIRPKLVVFRYTAGIYAEIDALEAQGFARLKLWLKGLKVMIAGVITSAIPIVPALYDKASGVDWTQIFPSEKTKLIGIAVAVLGIAGPMLMVVLHNAGLAEAASIEPKS